MRTEDQMDEEHAVAKRERAELEAMAAELAFREWSDARNAVAAALSTYRWWGWTNIVNSIRIAIQAWRQRRAARD